MTAHTPSTARLHAVCLSLLAACAPTLGPDPTLIAHDQILAVQAEPAEVPPGQSATYQVLAVGPDGPAVADAQWSFCLDPLPLTERGAIASACAADAPPAARGEQAQLALPSDACSRFGPIASPVTLRAREPDATGGYFQPVRIEAFSTLAFALERIRCPLAQATLAIAQEFNQRYVSNSNPSLTGLASSAPLDSLPGGSAVDLTVSWTDGSAETFPVYDPVTLTLRDQREALTAAWYATAGTFAASRTPGDATGAHVRWLAPAEAGRVYLWVVVHDSRGGLSWLSSQATVTPESP